MMPVPLPSTSKQTPQRPQGTRAAFSLMEVVVATGIMALGLAALGGMIGATMSKAKSPNLVGQAALLAAERLQGFRAQDQLTSAVSLATALTSVGGSYYPEPGGVVTYRPNEDFRRHNINVAGIGNINYVPTLFAREFLYEPSESQLAQAANPATISGTNARARGRANGGLQTALTFAPGSLLQVGANEIPQLPFQVGGVPVELVWPNTDGVVPAGAPAQVNDGAGQPFWRVPMPRVNPNLPAAGNMINNPAIAFVREVWCQVNQPRRGNLAAGPGGIPAVGLPSLANVWGVAFKPAPPYGVVVTVRVYRKDPRIQRYQANPPYQPAANPGRGVGYNTSHYPLAEMTAVIAQPE